MSTIQIVGIAVAAVIVLLLVVALLVTRKGGGEEGDAQTTPEHSSFLDSPPSDTLSKLGTPEHVPSSAAAEEPPSPPAVPPGIVRTATGVASAAGGLGLDWDHAEQAAPEATAAGESESTGEMPAVAGPAGGPAPEAEATVQAASGPEAPPESGVAEEAPAEAEAEAETPLEADVANETAATEAESDRLVPLSSIIVTTSTKMVDLDDPEIRRMLTDLVTFEIDQATQFREQGQSIDAVLQLTEAEKICRALGKADTAREIRDMMRGLQE
jgi:hypothetical protein